MEQRRRLSKGESSYFPPGFSSENLNLSLENISPAFYSNENPSHRNSAFLPERRSHQINQYQYGFVDDRNQFLESAFSRLSLSQAASPYRDFPSGLNAGTGTGELARQVAADPLRDPWYGSLGLNSNSGHQRQSNGGLMWFYNGGGQDFSGVHQNLMVGQRATHRSTETGAVLPLTAGGGVGGGLGFEDSASRNNFVGMNSALLHNRSNYQREDPFLQSKKQFRGGLNVQPPNVPTITSVPFLPFSPPTGRENLGLLNNLNRWTWNGFEPNFSEFELGKDFASLSLQDLRGRIVFLAKDQEGSRILQEKLNNPKEGEIEMVLSEVLLGFTELLRNQVGGFFFQKLFVVSSDEQRTRIVKAVTENPYNFMTICVNSQGARTLQNFMDSLITREHIALFVSAIRHNVVRLANDSNGQHVVRQCFIKFSQEANENISNEVANNCFRIGTDKSGCCVIQCCMDKAGGRVLDRLVEEIITNALPLSEDPFGNYVVQHLMSKKLPGVNGRILEQLKSHFLAMSCDKYASNVVEKFLVSSEEDHSRKIIFELLSNPNAATLLTDPYGNYVIQKALSFSGDYEFQWLYNFIRENVSSMRTDRFGQKILSCFEKDVRCKNILTLSRRLR